MTAGSSDPSNPSVDPRRASVPADFTDEEVFANVVDFGSFFKRLIPLLIMLFLLSWAVASGVLEAMGLPMAGIFGAAAAGGFCAFLTQSKKKQFAKVWGSTTLTLSPLGATTQDPNIRVHIPWSQVQGIGDASILDPLRVGGFHLAGKAVGALSAATARRTETGLLGTGRISVRDRAPGLVKSQVKQNLAGQDPKRAQLGVILTHYDKDWENGRIGQWIRVYRPDLMSSSGALVPVGEEEVSTRHGSAPSLERQSGRPQPSGGHGSVGVPPAAAPDSAVDGYRPPANGRRRRLALVVLTVGLLPFLFYSLYLRSGNDVARASGAPERVFEGLKRQSDAIDQLANGTPPTAPPQLGETAPQAPPQLPPQLAGTPEGRIAEFYADFYAAQQQIEQTQRQFEQQMAALEQLMADQQKRTALTASNWGISTAISALKGSGELKDPLHVISWEVTCDLIAPPGPPRRDVAPQSAVAEWLQANAGRYGIELRGDGAAKLAERLLRVISPESREGVYGACKSLSFPEPGAGGA